MTASRIFVLACVLASLISGIAAAELPPDPVERGDFYFSIGASIITFKTEAFEAVRIYADDDFAAAGTNTTGFDRGFLLDFNTYESKVFAPEIQLGYAFDEVPFQGALGSKARLHFSAYAYKREGGDVIGAAQPLIGSELLFNPNTGMLEARNQIIHVQPVDGSYLLPNGDNATWFHSFPLVNNVMSYDERLVSGDVMIYFDEPKGMWRFTRGAGLTFGYENIGWDWMINSPEIALFAPGMAPTSWIYSFEMDSIFLGPRAGFSIGFEPLRQLSIFVGGSFAPMLAITSIAGTQAGPCLFACTINGAASAGTYGFSKMDATDVNFAYDARLEAGASIYLWVIRFTGELGAFVNNQFSMPHEGNGERFETKLGHQWGYFGKAYATFSF